MMRERESEEEEQRIKEQWSSPERVVAKFRDTELLGLEPVERDSEADGLRVVHDHVAIDKQAIFPSPQFLLALYSDEVYPLKVN